MEKESIQVDLVQLLLFCLKKWWLILSTAVLGAALMFFYVYYTFVPQYTAVVDVYVNSGTISVASVSIGDLNTSQSLIPTYCYILKTQRCLEVVKEDLDLPYSVGQLKGMIQTSTVEDTGIFSISVTSTESGEEAATIANQLYKSLEGQISAIIVGSKAKQVDSKTPTQSSPQFTSSTVIGFVVGALVSIAYLTLVQVFDDTIRSEDWVIRSFKDRIPLLAVIPDAEIGSGEKYYKKYYSKYGSRSYKKNGYGYGYGYGQNGGYGKK